MEAACREQAIHTIRRQVRETVKGLGTACVALIMKELSIRIGEQ